MVPPLSFSIRIGSNDRRPQLELSCCFDRVVGFAGCDADVAVGDSLPDRIGPAMGALLRRL
jgi:hypothetical protein